MKNYFDIDTKDDFQRARVIQFILMLTTIFLSIFTRSHENSFFTFGFIFELFVLIVTFNFYFKAQKNRNHAYWGISFLLFLYLFIAILHYTFADYNPFILYFSFISIIFLIINVYIMSSPLFYPRVQWWEYDFRYRGDLKSSLIIEENIYESRVTDIRRDAGCIELFDDIEINSNIIIKLEFKNKYYKFPAIIKTRTDQLPGRPIRYGFKVDLKNLKYKTEFIELRKNWSESNKVKLRNKFKNIKTEKNA